VSVPNEAAEALRTVLASERLRWHYLGSEDGMTAAKLATAQREMRARQPKRTHGRTPPRKPMRTIKPGVDINAPIRLLKAGLERLAQVSMPYDVVMSEVARIYVRSAVKVHGSHTRAALAICAHRNTLHRVERER
jgi:hypothetical protein